MANSADVPKLYQSVVDDVISNVREAFLDDGVDEQILAELKQLWEHKLIQSKVLQSAPKQTPTMMSINPQTLTQQPTLTMNTVRQPAVTYHTPMPIIQGQRGLLDMSGAAQTATLALPPNLYQHQLQALQGGSFTLTQGNTQYIITPTPTHLLQSSQQGATAIATSVATSAGQQMVHQLDGPNDSSSDDDDDDDDDEDGDKDDDDDEQNDDNDEQGEEEEPLNSCDDVSSEEDPAEVFDTENVVVCQFDRINRNKNKWKFSLKDGIMNLNGRDYVFQKASGESEW